MLESGSWGHSVLQTPAVVNSYPAEPGYTLSLETV